MARVEEVPISTVKIKGASTESAINLLPAHGSAISPEVAPGYINALI
jgi:hypothetical protein